MRTTPLPASQGHQPGEHWPEGRVTGAVPPSSGMAKDDKDSKRWETSVGDREDIDQPGMSALRRNTEEDDRACSGSWMAFLGVGGEGAHSQDCCLSFLVLWRRG